MTSMMIFFNPHPFLSSFAVTMRSDVRTVEIRVDRLEEVLPEGRICWTCENLWSSVYHGNPHSIWKTLCQLFDLSQAELAEVSYYCCGQHFHDGENFQMVYTLSFGFDLRVFLVKRTSSTFQIIHILAFGVDTMFWSFRDCFLGTLQVNWIAVIHQYNTNSVSFGPIQLGTTLVILKM